MLLVFVFLNWGKIHDVTALAGIQMKTNALYKDSWIEMTALSAGYKVNSGALLVLSDTGERRKTAGRI